MMSLGPIKDLRLVAAGMECWTRERIEIGWTFATQVKEHELGC